MDTQKREDQSQEAEEQKRQPLWRQVRPGQLLLTGGSLLATGAADAVLHLDATGVFLGLLATFVIARHSNDILEALVPGADAEGVVAATERVVNAAAPQTSAEDDQAVGAKLRRLLFLKSRMPAPPSETAAEDAEAAEADTILIPEEEALAAVDRYAMQPLRPKAAQPNMPQQDASSQQPRKPGRRVPAIFGEDPRRRLLLAENFQPDANRIAKTGGFFVGVQGSGKTTAMVRTCEQYIQGWKLGGFYFDIKGIDFKGLVTSGFAPRGLIVTQGNINELEARYAEYGGLVRTALHNQWQVVFDLPTWREPDRTAMSRRLVPQIMTSAINELMAEAAAIPPGNGRRRPFIVAIDEVQRLAPQSKRGDADLLDALVGLSTTGRAAAVVPFFACPRIAEVDKDLIGSVELRAFGQATLLQDVKTYREYVGADAFSDEEIRGLGTGEMIVCMGESCVLAQFKDRETPHGSHNASVDDALAAWERGRPPTMPGMEALLHHEAPASRSYAPLAGQIHAYSPQPASVPYYQPARPYQPPAPQAGRSALPEQIAFQQPRSDALPNPPGVAPSAPKAFAAYAPVPYAQPAQTVAPAQVPVSWQEAEQSQTQHFTKAVGPELQAAYDAYRPGMNHHTLARILKTTPSVAGHLLKQLQLRGLIDATGKKTVVSPQVSQEDLREYDRAVAIWHDLEEKKRANVRDFAAAMKMGETNAWELLTKLDRLGLIHWERRKKKDVV